MKQRIVSVQDSLILYNNITNSMKNSNAKKSILQNLNNPPTQVITSRFSVYDNHTLPTQHHTIHTIPQGTFTQTQKDALEYLYTGSSTTLNRWKALHRSMQNISLQPYCPYCCIELVNDSYDHFLPKDTFPEYSIYVKNLIPCCSNCNSRKNNLPSNNFINFYFDTIPVQQFLFVNITYPHNLPVANFNLQNNGIQNFALINSHFTSLNLLERYKNISPSFISEILMSLRSQQNANVQIYLQNQATEYQNTYGDNYWKSVLYSQLSNDQYFLNNYLTF